MSRYRKVLSKIWSDEKFTTLSEDGQRLFLYHLTSDRATPFLLYIEGPGAISDTLRMPNRRLTEAMKELSSKGMVWYADDGSNYVFLPKALKHQENAPESPNSVKTWSNLLADLPKTPFYFKCLSHWLSLTEGITHALTIAFLKGLPAPNPTTNPIQEQEQEQEKKKNIMSDVEAIRLADLLFTEILRQQPKSKLHTVNNGKRQETINRWAEDIEKLKRIDQRGIDDIQAVILWATADEFWKSNILSGAKLREKWDTLVAQMERKGIEKDSRSSWLDT